MDERILSGLQVVLEMDFRNYIREIITKSQTGIEFGPSYSPILPKRDGYKTLVIDHADQETLREKYRPHGVNIDLIETVDAIDDGGELTLLSEDRRGFDFIVASHVFEHLTDPVLFLQRCERALKYDGKLILLVPDRRFCFDYLRPVSTCGHMLRAYLSGQKRHDAGALYDHSAYYALRNGAFAWGDPGNGEFVFQGNPAAGYAAAVHNSEDYVDCHAWVFTPSSFRLILHDLRSIGLISMREAFFEGPFGCEFMAILSRTAPVSDVDRNVLARQVILEAAQGGVNEKPAAKPVPSSAADGDLYVRSGPADQNAVDLFAGSWSSAFPPELGLQAGDIPLYDDDRIRWLFDETGGVNGLDILELGPLEASHTAMLLQAGARSVLGIEANKNAFLRCLIAKEIRGLKEASFRLEDFNGFLAHDSHRWPLIVASGVLYHMEDPLRTLELLAEHTDTLFLWTHVIDNRVMPETDPRRAPIRNVEEKIWRGETIRLHVRPYGSKSNIKFCGGITFEPRWMERDDLLKVLRLLGFEDIQTAIETPDSVEGPALCILARRKGGLFGSDKRRQKKP